MSFTDLNRNPSGAELRTFGILLSLFTVLVGGLSLRRAEVGLLRMGVVGVLACAAVLFSSVPRLRKPIYLGWTHATYPIGWTVSHLVMAVIFFLVITPVGLAVRCLRGDPLLRRFDADATTYWHRTEAARAPETYLKEF